MQNLDLQVSLLFNTQSTSLKMHTQNILILTKLMYNSTGQKTTCNTMFEIY